MPLRGVLSGTVNGPGSVDVDLRRYGACSVIFMPIGLITGFYELQAISADGSLTWPLVAAECGNSEGQNDWAVGGPVYHDQLRIYFSGAGAHRYRVALFDDMLAPFGRVILSSSQATIGASGTSTVVVGRGALWVREMQAAFNGNRTCQMELDFVASSVTVATITVGIVLAAVGGATISERIVLPPVYNMRARNLDGAASVNMQWSVIGICG